MVVESIALDPKISDLRARLAQGGGVVHAAGLWGYFILLDSTIAGFGSPGALQDAFQTAAAIVWGRGLPFALGFGWQFERVSGLSPAMTVTTALSVIAFLFVTCVSVSYVLSIGSVGNSLIYVNLRRRIRGDNVLEISSEARSEDESAVEPTTTERSETPPAETTGSESERD